MMAMAERCRLDNMRERLQPILASFRNVARAGWTLAQRENTMKLIEGFDSNYRYILVAARRARQLQGGAPPVVETPSRKPCRIAQDEIKAGKVKWVIPEMPHSAAEVASEMLDKALAKTSDCRLSIFVLISDLSTVVTVGHLICRTGINLRLCTSSRARLP